MPDIIAIEIGGIVYEAQMRPAGYPRARYSDVDYPPDHVDQAADEPLTTALGVRRTPADPWLDLPALLDDMLQMRSPGIRHRAGNAERATRLSVAGLGGAINWCRRAFTSARARRLPGRYGSPCSRLRVSCSRRIPPERSMRNIRPAITSGAAASTISTQIIRR